MDIYYGENSTIKHDKDYHKKMERTTAASLSAGKENIETVAVSASCLSQRLVLLLENNSRRYIFGIK